MKRYAFAALFLLAAVMEWIPHGVFAAAEEGKLPPPGDRFELWLWIALLVIGVAGFLMALFFLLVPTKRGKYERVEEKKKR